MSNEVINNNADDGGVKISTEVIASIAGVAATEVEGVVGMSGGIKGLGDMLGLKNISKGIKVEVGEKDTAIDLFIIVEYGKNISEIAKKVQSNVKTSIENMTGLNVIEVNVNVQGISMPKKTAEESDTKLK